MKLSQEEISRIKSKLSFQKCPICEERNYVIHEEAFFLPTQENLGQGLRMAVVFCPKCKRVTLLGLDL